MPEKDESKDENYCAVTCALRFTDMKISQVRTEIASLGRSPT